MKWLLALVVLLTLGFLFWHWDFSEPVIDWEVPPVLGKNFELSLDVDDPGRGIREIQIWFKQAGNEYSVHSEEYPLAPPWRKGPSSERGQRPGGHYCFSYPAHYSVSLLFNPQ